MCTALQGLHVHSGVMFELVTSEDSAQFLSSLTTRILALHLERMMLTQSTNVSPT
jgi:hypothetical protein